MTRRTLVPLIMLAVVTLLALTTGVGAVYRISYALALVLAVGFLVAWLKLRGLSAGVTRISGRTEVGRYFEEEITVTNNGRLSRHQIEVTEKGDLPGQGTGGIVDVSGKRGLPGQTVTKVRVLCLRRGVFRIGPIKLSVGDPLGFLKLGRRFGQRIEVIVHPEIVDIPRFNIPFGDNTGDQASRAMAYFVAQQASTVREYIDGDAMNRVHWPLTAHHGKLMVKEFDANGSSRAWIVVDMERRVQAGHGTESTEELAATIAASIARRLVRMGFPVGLISYGGSRGFALPLRGDGQLGRLLDTLAMLKAEGDVSLDRVLIQEERAMSRNDAIIVISPSIDSQWVRLLGDLGRRHAAAGVVAIDPSGYGVRVDIAPFLSDISRQRIPFCLIRKGEPLSEALSAWGGPGVAHGEWPAMGTRRSQ